MKVGDLVRPARGRRKGWVGLILEQRDTKAYEDDLDGAKDCLIQWAQHPKGPAWWVDWSLEVISEKTLDDSNSS